jgi:hypothetical protein
MSKIGSKNIKAINESSNRIESLTIQFKKKRMSIEEYIKEVHISLSMLTSERDYIEYLTDIGQISKK